MTASPAPASEPDEHADPARRTESTDRGLTIGLLVGEFLLMGVLSILPTASLAGDVCVNHPGECNEALRAFAIFMGGPALLIIFGASIVVSIVLLNRQRSAANVPVIGGVAMIGCFAGWFALAQNGFLIPYP